MKPTRLLLLAIPVLVGSIGLSKVAHSAAVGFTNAKPWQLADRDCFFGGSWAAIWNSCDDASHSRKVLLAVLQTGGGTHNFKATATDRGSGAGALPNCRAIINSENNTFINQTNLVTVGLTETLLGSMNVTGNSYSHHFDCDIFGGRYGMSSAVW